MVIKNNKVILVLFAVSALFIFGCSKLPPSLGEVPTEDLIEIEDFLVFGNGPEVPSEEDLPVDICNINSVAGLQACKNEQDCVNAGGKWRLGYCITTSTCVDSDENEGGKVLSEKGITYGEHSGKAGRRIDGCYGKKVIKFYCSNNRIVYDSLLCPNGQVCSDGRCI